MSVVGVDFGTQNAVIASAGRGGVDVILNGNSQRLNPNMVGFQTSRRMGEGASPFLISNYRNTITAMKRLIGLPFSSAAAQAEIAKLPYTCVEGKNGGVAVQVAYSLDNNSEEIDIPIEHVAGMMVQHMGSIASAAGNSKAVADWVIAVPGYYTDAQKRAMLAGCQMVGITQVLRLMHEHTATALAYGIFKDIRKEFTAEKETNVMFIDMGYSSYSATICTFVPGKLIVKSHQFDKDLGGRDFDWVIAQWINDKFVEKYGSKLSSSNPIGKPKVMLKMLAAAEKAKKTLSPAGVKEVRIHLECLMDDYDFNITLKADEYAAMCAPLLSRLDGPIQRTLEQAKLTPADLASVEIVGGATRVASVKSRFADLLKLNKSKTNNGLSTTMNADEAVARGAALQAAILSPRFKVKSYEIVEAHIYPIEVNWENTSSTSEGVETADEDKSSAQMFDRGSNFPVTKRVTLKKAGEFSVTANYPAEGDKPATELAKFVIKNPSDSVVKVRVNLKTDIHGIVSLSSAQMLTEVEEEEPVAPMETDAESKEGEAKSAEGGASPAPTTEEKKEVKKKIKKTNIDGNVTILPMEWSQKSIDEWHEVDVRMANADRIINETADMRNELESYIYSMRDRIISELSTYCKEEEKNNFSTMLENSENWLYEEGFDATKSVYAEKLKGLQAIGNPIEVRMTEANGRPAAMSSLQNTIERYKQWVTNTLADEKYDHIPDEDKNKCHKKCDETSSWMYDMLDKQSNIPSSADPVVTVAAINMKAQELMTFINPILNKPKPAPKKEPEKKSEASAEGDKPAEQKDASSNDMEVETTATESEVEATPMDTE